MGIFAIDLDGGFGYRCVVIVPPLIEQLKQPGL